MDTVDLKAYRGEHPRETKVQKYMREHDIAGVVGFNEAYHAGHVAQVLYTMLSESMRGDVSEIS